MELRLRAEIIVEGDVARVLQSQRRSDPNLGFFPATPESDGFPKFTMLNHIDNRNLRFMTRGSPLNNESLFRRKSFSC